MLVGVLVRGDGIFVPTTLAPIKRWDAQVERDPSVRLRAGGEIYAGCLERVRDDRLRAELFADVQRKWGKGLYFGDPVADATVFFRWESATDAR